jgi:ketopantoate hydroxymethyltransferase
VHELTTKAVQQYIHDVRKNYFPNDAESY